MTNFLELGLQKLLLMRTIGGDVYSMVLLLRGDHAVVHLFANVVHFAKLFEHGNERQEQRPVQAVEVQVLRRTVGGGNNHRPELEKYGEDALHDNGIADMCDLEFVEAQEPAVLHHVGRNLLNQVIGSVLRVHAAPLLLLVKPRMDINHPLVEVNALFLLNVDLVIEHVHHERLAGAGAPP